MIHTHSKHCVMVTMLYPGKEFRITHQEMIKGMKKGTTGVNYRWVVRVALWGEGVMSKAVSGMIQLGHLTMIFHRTTEFVLEFEV